MVKLTDKTMLLYGLKPVKRHRFSSFPARLIISILSVFIIANIFDVYHIYNLVHAPQKPAPLQSYRQARDGNTTRHERVFISALQYNTAALLRSHWSPAIIDLCKELGPENVYFSTYESGSTDDTIAALYELDEQLEKLGVQRTIVVDGWTHAQELVESGAQSNWIDIPNEIRFRRIPYLARLRNFALAPLQELANNGQRFDRILFLNDVVFTAQDALSVLSTNNGDYAAACALDFINPPNFYDSFALFDSNGDEFATKLWPYFASSDSRRALIRRQPVPVRSCWSGLAAFDASPFIATSSNLTPLTFRAIPLSLSLLNIDASECCLIHADNPLSSPSSQTTIDPTSSHGIYLNPNVQVGYTPEAYTAVHNLDASLGPFTIFGFMWYNRLSRWTGLWPFCINTNKRGIVPPRMEEWRRRGKLEGRGERVEQGEFCLTDGLLVLNG